MKVVGSCFLEECSSRKGEKKPPKTQLILINQIICVYTQLKNKSELNTSKIKNQDAAHLLIL